MKPVIRKKRRLRVWGFPCDSRAWLKPLPVAVVLAVVAAQGCTPTDRSLPNTDSPTVEKATGNPVSSPGRDWVVTASSFGPLRLGVPVGQVASVLGDTARPADESCGYVAPATLPDSVSVMIVNDTAFRVDVRNAKVRTAEGAAIGDTEQRIGALYPGRLRTEPHKYTSGRYLIVTPADVADSAFRIVFETDGARVVNYRAGRLPSVLWVEGCS
jgi:hypothetical protein